MSLKDYEHWNEDAQYMWWQEEGRHPYEPDYDSFHDDDPRDFYDDEDDEL